LSKGIWRRKIGLLEEIIMKLSLVLAAVPLALAAFSASAQSMKPGLWEHSFTMKSQSGQMERGMAEMQKQLAAMPPEQRKMMEQMMAKNGVGMGTRANTAKVCISPEQAARMDLPQQDGQCKQDVTQRSGSTMKFKFSCAGQPPTSGEGEVTFSSPTSYSSKSVVNTVIEGKPERMTMDQIGKWLAADCGALKPVKR
jgi:hypothetical protein